VSVARERRRNVLDAIFADEAGIEYAIHGEYRLRSAYQPIFAPREGFLVAVAVEALIEPHRGGQGVSPIAFFESLDPGDRRYVETMCRVLHLRNFRSIGNPKLDLFFNYNPRLNDHRGRGLAEIRLMAMHLGDIGLNGGMLVCEITEQAAPDDALLVGLVREMRRYGIRIAVDDFGAGHSTAERVGLIEPDIVKIDGAWFAQLCSHAAAERLFRPLVCALHDRNIKVLVEGIENATHLRIALEGGADLIQGYYLGRPKLAGMIFPAEPLSVECLVHAKTTIVPFPLMRRYR
jgi:EAL domain-containing protein (putative c-di-GMP-specific phosphodiesterase class I)